MQRQCLNQCWNIVNWTLRNKLQWNFNRNSYIFIQENAFEKVVCKIAAILCRSQCVNAMTPNKRNIFFVPWIAILHGQSNRYLSVWGMLCLRHISYWFIIKTVVLVAFVWSYKCTEFTNRHAFYALTRIFIQYDDHVLLCSVARVVKSFPYIPL